MNGHRRRQFFGAAFCLWFVLGNVARADPAQLAMSSLIQYSKVIQGGQDPVYAYIYNDAPAGSDTLSYQVTTAYPYPSTHFYTGTKIADGGANYVTVPFSFDSSQVSPGTYGVSVTGTNTASGGSVTQSGNVTVLGMPPGAHPEQPDRLSHLEIGRDVPISYVGSDERRFRPSASGRHRGDGQRRPAIFGRSARRAHG